MENRAIPVAYLSYDGLTDPLGQSQIIPYLVGLSKYGYRFTIFSFEKPNRFNLIKNQIEPELNECGMQWYPIRYTKWPPVISTIWDIWNLWRGYKREYKKQKFKIVHCRSYITSLVGLRSKRQFATKFIFDMRGFWADERVEGGLWDIKNPLYKSIYRYFKIKEQVFLKQADAVVTLTQVSKRIIEEKYRVENEKIEVIPCCVDTELFNVEKIVNDEKIALRNKLGIPKNDFVLIYVGSIGTWYMIDEMLTFFKVLTSINKNVSFLLLTKEPPGIIIDKANKHEIDLNKIFIAAAERNQVPLHISIADYGISFIHPTFSKQASFPTKLAEILSMGLPMVTNSSVGDIDYMFRNHDLGVLIKGFNNEHFLESISQMFLKKKSIKLREYALERFSLVFGVDTYKMIYRKLT